MNFEVDRSTWAHIALCADLTWATEPPDEFVIANQRLWSQHCRLTQLLQEYATNLHKNQCETAERSSNQSQENGSDSGRRSVKDVIPESRLAQFYGNFYYDEDREKCYSSSNDRVNTRGYNEGYDNTDLTECWMLPEVDYWFRKLLDEPSERGATRRRRQYRMPPDDDFERWSPSGSRGEEAALAARVSSVRGLWASPPRRLPNFRTIEPGSPHRNTMVPSPPPVSRKIRARRRQPRRLNAMPPPPPPYCVEIPAQLLCNPTCKFQFDVPRPRHLAECQRAMGRLTASVQAAIRASTARCPYRGTNVSRFAPTGQRPARSQERKCIWWPRDHVAKPDIKKVTPLTSPKTKAEDEPPRTEHLQEEIVAKDEEVEETHICDPIPLQEEPDTMKEVKAINDDQQPSTSAALDSGLKAKRLYSTVLSMSAPPPIAMPSGCIRLAQKLVTPGILKLNPRIVMPRVRPPNVDHKFEELEKEALEQYKPSDESIDTKFQELEKQAEEQYSNSNSNTSCSSADKKLSNASSETDTKTKKTKFRKEKARDSVVIYSQNFPDLKAKQTSSVMSLKNFQGPPRGEKKDRGKKSRTKGEHQAASDTDYGVHHRSGKNQKGSRWPFHGASKKRHLTTCVSDFSSDEEMGGTSGSIKDAAPRAKSRTGKIKLSAHGGGDLKPILKKTQH